MGIACKVNIEFSKLVCRPYFLGRASRRDVLIPERFSVFIAEAHACVQRFRAIILIHEKYIPTIINVDRSYIRDIATRAVIDIENSNFDSAITKSRTLLEETFCYVIELKGEVPTTSGRIGDLYTQVKQLYNMHQSKDIDNRINSLLKGLEKIVSAIAEMRNNSSDAHGVGQKRYNIEAHHARLFVNSAATMADFILAVAMRKPSIEQ